MRCERRGPYREGGLHMNEDIERMVQAINREIPQLKGALRLWGQTFTRPYGNLYAVVECIGVGDQLILASTYPRI